MGQPRHNCSPGWSVLLSASEKGKRNPGLKMHLPQKNLPELTMISGFLRWFPEATMNSSLSGAWGLEEGLGFKVQERRVKVFYGRLGIMKEWLDDWMIGWLDDWLIEWLDDWLIEWLGDWSWLAILEAKQKEHELQNKSPKQEAVPKVTLSYIFKKLYRISFSVFEKEKH